MASGKSLLPEVYFLRWKINQQIPGEFYPAKKNMRITGFR
jgi:hypothetical protein